MAQSQEAYTLEAQRIEKRYNAALEHFNTLEAEKEKRNRKSKELKAFIAILKQQPLTVTEWTDRIWSTLLDTVMVYRDGRIVFQFKCERKIIT